jgi:hypothetical protein
MLLLQFHVFEDRSGRGATGIAMSALRGFKELPGLADASRGA